MTENRVLYEFAAAKGQFSILFGELAQIIRNGLQFNPPPPGFNPLRASTTELNRYFLPPRPDARRAPRTYENWAEAMSPPLSWVRNVSQVERLFLARSVRSLHKTAGGTGLPRAEPSQNWSGGYGRPRDFSRMSLVQAKWVVPLPAASSHPAPEYASSVWVGLDGHDPASQSMPQIGTGQYVVSQTAGGLVPPNVFAWWQWFHRSDPMGQQVVIDPQIFPVSAGDTIYGQVQALGSYQVSLFLKNKHSGLAFSAWFFVQLSSGVRRTLRLPRIEGRTADWILERPRRPDSQKLFPLANYTHCAFFDCAAGAGSFRDVADLDLHHARLIRMNDWDANESVRGTEVSRPHLVDDATIDLEYRDSV